MYAGRIVEQGRADVVLRHPRHPYTRGPPGLDPRSRASARPRADAGNRGRRRRAASRLLVRAALPTAQRALRRRDAAARARLARQHEVRCFHWEQTPGQDGALRFSRAHPPLGRLPCILARAHPRPHRLEVEGLHAEHRSRRETVVAANDVSFAVEGARHVSGTRRRIGQWQDDDRAGDRRAASNRQRSDRCSTARSCRASSAAGRSISGGESSSSPRTLPTRSTRATPCATRSAVRRGSCADSTGARRRPRSTGCSIACGCRRVSPPATPRALRWRASARRDRARACRRA